MMDSVRIAFLCGLVTMGLLGCQKPCATTADCGAGEVCAAALCRELNCEEAMLVTDPATGACVALSGCYLTQEQRTWQTCQEDPCTGLAETSCISDTRCQPSYAVTEIESRPGEGFHLSGCDGSGGQSDDGSAPGVNNGDRPKHGAFDAECPMRTQSHTYAGCRAVPQLPSQDPCKTLTQKQCESRPDCTPLAPNPCGINGICFDTTGTDKGMCTDLHPLSQGGCEAANQMTCLLNPACQPIGTPCYCPPGGSCECSGGVFKGCESNDRLRRCSSSADCRSGERCDNDEACIAPRTFTSPPIQPSGPGAPDCLGACVPMGCAGLGESQCNANPACDAGHYRTVCRLKYYGTDGAPSCSFDSSRAGITGGTCGCGSEYLGCAEQNPPTELAAERSLLVRDPEIIDDPAFNLRAVLTKLAPAGQVDLFTRSLLSQIMSDQPLANGATAKARPGFSKLYGELDVAQPQLAQRFSALMATTALINRLDLASSQNCGEARLSFAMTTAYKNGNQRLTMIVELKVPDDGHECQTVAQRWAELSLLQDAAERRTRLIALYDELLTPAHLGQIRTNEFVNPGTDEPWELREFHLRPTDGMPAQAPVAQTMNPLQIGNPELLAWVNANVAGLQSGTAIIPQKFLAAASSEDGARLFLGAEVKDPAMLAVEKSLNALSCAGCHLTETKSPFVHIGERLAQKVGSAYRPSGRAVIDDFLQQELIKRKALLARVQSGANALIAQPWRPAIQGRVH